MLRQALSPQQAAELFAPERALALLRAAWPHAVGSRLAERTELRGFDGGTLLVAVPDAGWRRLLHRMRREILARLRDIAGPRAPRALGFVEVAPSARPMPPEPAREAAVAQPDPPPAPALVASAAAAIGDAELRAHFLDAAARYLARARRA